LLALGLACGGNQPQTAQPPAGGDGAPQRNAKAAGARPDRLEKAPKAKATAPALEQSEAKAKGDGRPTVVMVILDTVRTQSTSLCGYDRPTTPFMESLRDRTKVSVTCDAYAPATWTIPTHASYFTGMQVPEHGTDSMGFAMPETAPVLSEIMNAKGYQSVMVSANPTLSKSSGLQRGFQHVDVTKGLTTMRGDDVRKAVRAQLAEIDETKPLFLFVNIIDAHDPYPRIPEGVSWAPARTELPFDVHDREQDTPYHKFIRGELSPERSKAYTDAIRDGYDYGVFLADQALEGVVQQLRRDGWLKNGFRIAITSDHGEFLGEHTLLRHGCFTWEEVTKVPFLYYDSRSKQQLDLSPPFAATNIFWLMSEGRLPDDPMLAQSFSKRRAKDVKKGADMAALWLPGDEKLIWKTDTFYQVDLEADPGEADLQALGDHEMRPVIEQMAADHRAHLVDIRQREKNGERDEDRVNELAILGYVE
jgi:hypothetical protein